MSYEGPYPEEIRVKKVDEFYKAKPMAIACDLCVVEITPDARDRSCEETGFRLCGFCLAIYMARERIK